MTKTDVSIVSEKIEDEKEHLQYLSQQIWENPEIQNQEIFAHNLLAEALEKYGFDVKKKYLLPTAFRAEFSRKAGIITKGGVAPNIIPGEAEMEFYLRAPTIAELKSLKEKVKTCFESGALATGCEVLINFHSTDTQNVITNKVLGTLFRKYAENLGLMFTDEDTRVLKTVGSTDMGNVSHVVPSIHPFYDIGPEFNHTKEFKKIAASAKAQTATLAASKAMALVAITIMRSPNHLQEMKEAFKQDMVDESIDF